MILAKVVDRVGDPPVLRERLFEVVGPGEIPWTWVLRGPDGAEIVRHHDTIENAWDLTRKRAVGGQMANSKSQMANEEGSGVGGGGGGEDWNAGAVVVAEQVGGTDGK